MQSTTSGERGMAGAMHPIILSLTATVPSRNIHVPTCTNVPTCTHVPITACFLCGGRQHQILKLVTVTINILALQ